MELQGCSPGGEGAGGLFRTALSPVKQLPLWGLWASFPPTVSLCDSCPPLIWGGLSLLGWVGGVLSHVTEQEMGTGHKTELWDGSLGPELPLRGQTLEKFPENLRKALESRAERMGVLREKCPRLFLG